MGKHVSKHEKKKLSLPVKFNRRRLLYIGFALLGLIFVASIFKLTDRLLQKHASEKVMTQAQQAVSYEVKNPVSAAADSAGDKKPEKQYDEICPITVDFDYLCGINEDVKGWLYCPDTQINFEVMQGVDNNYYLYRLMDRTKNMFGTIFMDYRGAPDFSDANTLIYGHDMQNGSMFGELELYKKQEYYDNHPVIYLLTPSQNYRLELLCGFLHTAESDMYNVPSTAEEVEWYLYDAINMSTFESKFRPQEGDRFTTLTTCADDYEAARYAIICRMVEIG